MKNPNADRTRPSLCSQLQSRVIKAALGLFALGSILVGSDMSAVPAFPGAEGFGANAVGGRGGDVYYVTNLNDSGAGSLRQGIISATGPRTIAFKVSGTIVLQSILTINKSYITIAGQTAPGDGICIRDFSVNISNARDVVIRCLRIRRGDVRVRAAGQPSGSTGLDTVSIDDSLNIIFDHVSLSWSCDEIFGIVQNRNVTVQWCIISEPLGDPLIHPYGTEHAYGMNNSANTLSAHHNLIAKYVMRGPQFEANDALTLQGYAVWMESINNVLFDYKNSGARYTTGIETNPGAAAGIAFRFHFLNNFYIRNPSRTGTKEIDAVTKHGVTNQVRVHVAGNIGPSRPNNSLDQWAVVFLEDNTNIRQAPADVQAQMSDVSLFSAPVPVTMHSASNAYKGVISLAGYNNVRDPVDLRVISNVVNRTWANYLHSQSEVGGWPTLNTYDVPVDADSDGLPDYWENAVGLNPSVANNNHLNPDGYTDLEHYLNWLAGPHGVSVGNSFVDLDLKKYSAGFANPVFVVSNPTNGVVSMLPDGRTARFTPQANLTGLSSFQFVATDAAGGITNNISILVTPPPPAPHFNAAKLIGANTVLSGSGGPANSSYVLLASNDLFLPLQTWLPISTNQFDASGDFAITNTVSELEPQVFYRLRLL